MFNRVAMLGLNRTFPDTVCDMLADIPTETVLGVVHCTALLCTAGLRTLYSQGGTLRLDL